MIVIGVTGTSGKSTTCYLLARMFDELGIPVGMASTILFKVKEKEWLNDQKMTMVGRFQLQGLLAKMARAKCRYAIVETTSEGIKQHRHQGIHYDIGVFTNLYQEHIESHGSFENYQAAKQKLFKKIEQDPVKVIGIDAVSKAIVVNGEDAHAEDFLDYDIPAKYVFSAHDVRDAHAADIFLEARDVRADGKGIQFSVDGETFSMPILGGHNVYNALAAICVGLSQGFSLSDMARALSSVGGIPGRLERIDEGQSFTVIVDYAFEPRAMENLYETVRAIPHKRIIHVLGGTGGGRDRDRRPKIGAIAGEHADEVIVTNEDPYDEDPIDIIRDVASGAESRGKARVEMILDRGEAIQKAILLAQPEDIVLITGKGSEQAIAVQNGKLIPWDDREAARNALNRAHS